MQIEAPDSVLCVYCGLETVEYQLVSQIPTNKCPQSFLKSELVVRSRDPMKDDDYVCFDHEELLYINHLQFKQSKPFCRGFKNTTHDNQTICALF